MRLPDSKVMATPISDEELQLKKRARRRLIGAIALVTVVAVFLPMVLDHEPKSITQDISIQIPSQNAGTFTSKIVPVVPGGIEGKALPPADAAVAAPTVSTAAEPSKIAVAPTPPVASEAATPKATVAEAKPKAKTPPPVDSEAAPPKAIAAAPKAKSKVAAGDSEAATPKAAADDSKAKPKTKTAKAEGHDSGSFVVQVAALTDTDKAKQMREQITAAGVKAYTEVVPTAKGSVTRVRAGPFGSRDAADKARARLKQMGLAGNVVPK